MSSDSSDDDFQDPSQAISRAQTLIFSSLQNNTSQSTKISTSATLLKKPKTARISIPRSHKTRVLDSSISGELGADDFRSSRPLWPINAPRPMEKLKPSVVVGKENCPVLETQEDQIVDCSISAESNKEMDEALVLRKRCGSAVGDGTLKVMADNQYGRENWENMRKPSSEVSKVAESSQEKNEHYLNSTESRLLGPKFENSELEEDGFGDFEPGLQLNELLSSQPQGPPNADPQKKLKSSVPVGKEHVVDSSISTELNKEMLKSGSVELRTRCEAAVGDGTLLMKVKVGKQHRREDWKNMRKKPNEDCAVTPVCNVVEGFQEKNEYYLNSIESRLLGPKLENSQLEADGFGDFEPGSQLNKLMNLCSEVFKEENPDGGVYMLGDGGVDRSLMGVSVECPLCGADISDLSEESRQLHTNDCLDGDEISKSIIRSNNMELDSPQQQVLDVSPVLEWLRNLGLSKYEDAFIKEEIDWGTLQWLSEEDLVGMGITALGPRKKIVHALQEIKRNMHEHETSTHASKTINNESKNHCLPGNKLITEFFQGPVVERNMNNGSAVAQQRLERSTSDSGRKRMKSGSFNRRGRLRDIPPWCCVPGTPFLVDAFRHLRRDCSHWFLSHFHIDHYQGLTRGFCHGMIYCSSITARLVNMKIGIPWDRLQILPLGQKVSIEGVNVVCFDANHCPGSIIILFEPPNNKAVLHTGDFRFSEEMGNISILQSCPIHTLILDTTYCNQQYDFPKQETVIQFVVEAIQAEAFNPKTLFLIGSYTIGKERLFLEVARCLQKKIYVDVAKLELLRCLDLPEEDMKWLTSNEHESHIHVVPMWMIASFKRMKQVSHRYSDRFNLIVAFSPTGWMFGKGKTSPGRRRQQGTIIRYEVPYSEHCSFTELREFVKFLSPETIIPSVNNSDPETADTMIALLMSES